jgi:hypothetical protein
MPNDGLAPLSHIEPLLLLIVPRLGRADFPYVCPSLQSAAAENKSPFTLLLQRVARWRREVLDIRPFRISSMLTISFS